MATGVLGVFFFFTDSVVLGERFICICLGGEGINCIHSCRTSILQQGVLIVFYSHACSGLGLFLLPVYEI